MAGNISLYTYLAASLSFATLALLLSLRWRVNRLGTSLVLACTASTVWGAIIALGTLAEYPPINLIQLAELLRNVAWMYFLLQLLGLQTEGTTLSVFGRDWRPLFLLGAAVALGLVLAPLTVLYPDLRPGLGSGLTLLTFASPILYPESLVPPRLLGLLEWNPFTHFLRLYRLPLEAAGGGAGPADLLVVVLVPLGLVALGVGLGGRLYWPARDRL